MGRKLDDWLVNYLKYTYNSEPSEMYRLWSAIALISTALQRKVRFELGAITFYPNMYIVLVGPPAARKGTAMDMAYGMLFDLDVSVAAESTTRESLIQALDEASYNHTTEDGKMYMHNSLTVWAQELTVFLGYNNPTLMSDLADWYDCRKRWVYRTKTQGTNDINGVFVTLFGATTPMLLRATLPMDAIGGGLASRIIFVYEPSMGKIVAFTGRTKEEEQIGEHLKSDLAKINMLYGKFVMTKSFLDDWVQWYVNQVQNPPFQNPKFEGYLARRATHVAKLCMIVNASRTDKMVIDSIDLEKAIKIIEKTEIKMQETFAGFGRSSDSETLASVMADIANSGKVMLSELQYRYRDDANSWMLNNILETLRVSKFIITIQTANDTTIWYHKAFKKEEV